MSTRPRPPAPTDLRPSRERDRIDPPVPDAVEPPPSRIPKKLRKLGKFLAIVLLAALAWTAWAVYAVHDLASALQNLDPVGLERRVDWVAVQQALREDLAGRPAAGSGFTRQSVAQLVRTAKLEGTASEDARFWGRVEALAYSGGPFALRVDLRPDGDKGGTPMTLLFKWSGDWRLARVFLPAEAASPAARPAPSADAGSVFPRPPAAPSPAGTASPSAASAGPRAVLFEEDPANPEGKRYEGSVVWRTEQAAPTAGASAEPTVRADVKIPERPLAMTLTMRRNTDKTLPASHIIDVKFDLPADSTTGGIQDVPGILLKQAEDGRGTRLAGISVNVSQNIFLIGLSAIEVDVDYNVRLMKDRAWFDIPISYKSRARAVLAVEKGPTGEKAIADALTRWTAAATADKDSQKK